MKMHSAYQLAALIGWTAFAVACFVTLRFPAFLPQWAKWIAWSGLGVISMGIMVFWWKMAFDGSVAGAGEAYPAERAAFAWSQFLPTLIKVMVQTALPVISVTLIYFVTDLLGKKTLPHLYGIEFTPQWMPNPQVVLPQAVFVGSLLAFAAFGWLTVLAFMAYGLTAPMFLGSLAGLLIVGGSWGQYTWLSRTISGELKEIHKVYTLPSGKGDKKRVAWNPSNPEPGKTAFPDNATLKSRYRRLVEYRLGSREWNAMVFHRMADEPFGLAFRFPGYLIGLEQANRYLIGVPEGENRIGDGLEIPGIGALLNDRRRTFLSHIVEFENRDPGTGSRHHSAPHSEMVKTNVLYNIYESREVDSAFARGFDVLDSLRNTMDTKLKEAKTEVSDSDTSKRAVDSTASKNKPYTHILLFCMGWNTDQQESIRNYNSLMGFMASAAESDKEQHPFRPLVIGLSWPSEWSYLKPLSYLAKAGDADETGLVWGSYLLEKVLEPLKSKYRIPLVLIGHSFGARVLTRAIASKPDWIKDGRDAIPDSTPTAAKPDSSKTAEGGPHKAIDLFVGLQGAVSANRFVQTGPLVSGWWEGTPYSDLVKMPTRFIFTWSKFDKANPLAAYVTGAHHMGGKIGYEYCLQHLDSIFLPVKYAENDAAKYDPSWPYKKEWQRFDPQYRWEDDAVEVKGKIFTMDVSSIVKDQPYGKGGGAHSDIYTPEIGRLLWKSIVAFATVKPEEPASGQVDHSLPDFSD